jgi:uncharacterized membrane protein
MLLKFLNTIIPLVSQPETDFMRQTGKIYVVFGVLAIIFIGIIIFLIILEKKIRVIEKRTEHDKIK